MTQKPLTETYLRDRVESRRHRHFVRAAFAVAQGHATQTEADRLLDSPDDMVARAMLGIHTRADQTVGTTTVSGWASQLAQTAFRAYLGSLAQYSAAARLIALAQPAAMPHEVAALYPVRAAGPTVPQWVAEAAPIPVVSATLSNITLGPAKKLGHIVAWSRELSKRSDADAIFEKMLREDVVAGLDGALLATTGVSSAAAAGLLNGVSALTGYGGGDEIAMKTDLTALATAVATGGSGNVLFIAAPQRVANMRILAPELIAQIDIAPSAAVPATRVIAIDPAAILMAIDPEPDFFATKEALLHMSDVPLEIVSGAPVTSDPVRSLYQSASFALRVLHDLAFAPTRATAVAYVDSVTW